MSESGFSDCEENDFRCNHGDDVGVVTVTGE